MVLGQNVFLNRIPILDSKSRTYAYEIEFFAVPATPETAQIERIRRLSSLIAILDTIDPTKLLGDRKAMVRVEPDDVALPVPAGWQERLILQVPSSVLADIHRALPDQTGENKRSWCISDPLLFDGTALALPANCLVRIDISNFQESGMDSLVRAFKTPSVRLIATSVDDQEQFNRCMRAGVDLFMGSFFTQPPASIQKSISPSQSLLLELSAQTNQNGDIRAIEAIFKKNPDLAFGLMNLVHSAYYRVSEHVASIRQAIALLGYENLHRWVALMLFTIERSDPSMNPLFEKALIRARTMELAATRLRQKGLGSSAYISGIFSLIPPLFNTPIEEILTKANFVDEIKQALLERSGVVGDILTAVEQIEKGSYETFQYSQELGLRRADLFGAYTEAIMEYAAPAGQKGANKDSAIADQSVRDGALRDRKEIVVSGSRDCQERPSWIRRLLSLFGFTIRRGSPA
jgi:c-di-GMP-related signal transduction protein